MRACLGLITTTAVVAAMLAIAFAFLLTNKHIVLRLPQIGFVLHYLLGGPLPPYMDTSIYQPSNQEKWSRVGDVFLAVPGKSGTTWLMNTMHHIRYRGAPPEFRDIYEEVRWGEFVYYPGQPMEERIEVLRNTSRQHEFSIYKTHAGCQALGGALREDAFYIVQARNLVDVAASLYPFFRNMDAGFARMWGGFPVGAGRSETPEDMAKYEFALLNDMGSGRPMLDVLVLDLLAEFWPHRHRPNVLLVHYADRVAEPLAEIARLAKFIGIELTPEEIALVHARTEFAQMKRESHKFDLKHVLDPYRALGKVPDYVKGISKDLVNVGPTRNSAASPLLSRAFQQRIIAHVERRFGKRITAWLMQRGGKQVPEEEEDGFTIK